MKCALPRSFRSTTNNQRIRRNAVAVFDTTARRLSPALLILAVAAVGRASVTDSKLIDYLEAGEYSLAVEWADASPPWLRDRQFSAIATSQSQTGARQAALATAMQISDDRMRTSTFDTIRSYSRDPGARGGGVQADFDSLIELITATIAPPTWDELGGPGAISEFEGGVFVDSSGSLQRLQSENDDGRLLSIRHSAQWVSSDQAISTSTELRCVSLSRLERAVQSAWASGEQPTESMQTLAGLEEIQYLFVFPKFGDIVLAGPAGAWRVNEEGCRVNATSGRPSLHLDDLVELLRNAFGPAKGRFSCSIDPQRENLARTQTFLTASARKPLRPGQTARRRWLDRLRDSMGGQDISIRGIGPATRTARVIVEADYQMKLVGMGIEDAVVGVDNYFETLSRTEKADPATMDVIRWWFTMHYDAIRATNDHTVFELEGSGVRVLSENEMITASGERRHTGRSDRPNSEYARQFTRNFDLLAKKYPIFRELQNLFDMAMFASLMREENLPQKVNWSMEHFLDPERFQVRQGRIPKTVDSVVNHRQLRSGRFVAGVSGGVHVDPTRFLASAEYFTDAEMDYQRKRSEPKDPPPGTWWWNAAR